MVYLLSDSEQTQNSCVPCLRASGHLCPALAPHGPRKPVIPGFSSVFPSTCQAGSKSCAGSACHWGWHTTISPHSGWHQLNKGLPHTGPGASCFRYIWHYLIYSTAHLTYGKDMIPILHMENWSSEGLFNFLKVIYPASQQRSELSPYDPKPTPSHSLHYLWRAEPGLHSWASPPKPR